MAEPKLTDFNFVWVTSGAGDDVVKLFVTNKEDQKATNPAIILNKIPGGVTYQVKGRVTDEEGVLDVKATLAEAKAYGLAHLKAEGILSAGAVDKTPV